jgi:hypothetical protein
VLASANPRAESKNIPDAPDGEQIDWDDDGDDANVMTANDRLAKLRMSNFSFATRLYALFNRVAIVLLDEAHHSVLHAPFDKR